MSTTSLSSALCDQLTKELAPHSQQDSGPLAPPSPPVVPDETQLAFQDTLADVPMEDSGARPDEGELGYCPEPPPTFIDV